MDKIKVICNEEQKPKVNIVEFLMAMVEMKQHRCEKYHECGRCPLGICDNFYGCAYEFLPFPNAEVRKQSAEIVKRETLKYMSEKGEKE